MRGRTWVLATHGANRPPRQPDITNPMRSLEEVLDA